MVFALKLAMEIADYKKHPFHVLFVDLVKAYDSVSRAGLWAVLRKKGVPPRLLRLIQMYYTGKSARVCVEGNLSDSFDLSTGLGQGCCLAPLLFNIFCLQFLKHGRRSLEVELSGSRELTGHFYIGIPMKSIQPGSRLRLRSWVMLMMLL